MKRYNVLLSAAAVSALVIWGAGCGNAIQSLRARDQLNKGINAFKSANYPQAVEHFKTAIQLDPNFLNARLYLASTYMSQYVPGADSEENKRNAEAAMKGFMDVLERDPNNQLAVDMLGSLCYNQAKTGAEVNFGRLDDAKKWYLKLIQLNPNKKEAYYNIAVIDWAKAYDRNTRTRAKTGMRPDEPGPIKDKKAREQLKDDTDAAIKEGIEVAQKALAIDPNYEDAMGYLSLLYRQQADIAETVDESKKLTAQAETWMQRTLDVKKKKTERTATPKTG